MSAILVLDELTDRFQFLRGRDGNCSTASDTSGFGRSFDLL